MANLKEASRIESARNLKHSIEDRDQPHVPTRGKVPPSEIYAAERANNRTAPYPLEEQHAGIAVALDVAPKTARRLARTANDEDEFTGVGYLALVRAARDFRGNFNDLPSWRSYARAAIQFAIYKVIRKRRNDGEGRMCYMSSDTNEDSPIESLACETSRPDVEAIDSERAERIQAEVNEVLEAAQHHAGVLRARFGVGCPEQKPRDIAIVAGVTPKKVYQRLENAKLMIWRRLAPHMLPYQLLPGARAKDGRAKRGAA